MLIETLEYRIDYLHDRFMLETYINGYYDSFRRVRGETLQGFVGKSYSEDFKAKATYVLTLKASGEFDSWSLTTFVDEVKLREVDVTNVAARRFLNAPVIPFPAHRIGDDADVNYQYSEAYRNRNEIA